MGGGRVHTLPPATGARVSDGIQAQSAMGAEASSLSLHQQVQNRTTLSEPFHEEAGVLGTS